MKTNQKIIISVLLVNCFILGCSVNSATDASASSIAPSDLDNQLSGVISRNSLTKLSEPTAETTDLVLLGETLFSEKSLSGNRDISCMSCHSTSAGTVDGLPFSIGTGASGIGSLRKQINGQSNPTTRNAPALYNLGRANQVRAFLDGRVSLINQTISSSVSEISGANPSRSDIKNVFTSVFDVQPLFPLLSATEMLGKNNDLASHTTDVAIWQSILSDRLLNQVIYADLFKKAFPATSSGNLNPGHIGRALGAFMKIKFKSNNSAFDKYVSGNLISLTDSQKQGMLLFYTKAQCVRCHAGSNFSDQNFHSVAAPQIGFQPFTDDLGRAADSGLTTDQYKFKTPSLRNISLTAPYMHDGSLETLESVVNHYSNVQASLNTYQLPGSYQGHYDLTLVYDSNSARNQTRINQIDNPVIRNGLNLSTSEKAQLVDFLRNGLRDNNFN